MLSKGEQIGNYIIEEEIGGGGMARLYRVRHAVLKTRHALKVLDPVFRESPEVRDRFLSEALIGSSLIHPNIVRVTDTVSTKEVAGIVMELVAGPNLEQHLRGLAAPPSADSLRELFLPVLEAVGYAHDRGIVHRDIKPANIMLDLADGILRPKVTDFGIAKVTEVAKEITGQKGAARADARMGTLAYMSPEQIRRSREVTIRSDIFSLGATLYELATRTVAFSGDSDYDLMHQIVNGHYRGLEDSTDLDPVIAAAIARALQPQPEDRFASCAEFAAALKEHPAEQRVVTCSAETPVSDSAVEMFVPPPPAALPTPESTASRASPLPSPASEIPRSVWASKRKSGSNWAFWLALALLGGGGRALEHDADQHAWKRIPSDRRPPGST